MTEGTRARPASQSGAAGPKAPRKARPKAPSPATPKGNKKKPRSNGRKPEATATPPKRRGRPPGSKTLKLETAQKIAQLISNGAFLKRAVRLGGLNLRTFYEWMQLGEGNHPTRKGSAKHRQFAEIVNEAIAAAHGGAQIRLYSKSPERWIQEARKDTDEARGPAGADGAILAQVAQEDLLAEAERMVMALLESGTLRLRPCADANCNCGHHESSDRSELSKVRPRRAGAATKRPRQTRTRTKRTHDAN
jgi:hypothetical protein